ncbi:hypothetical protein LF1_49860 [Rubripirellula obstinata]|uniref:Uncharacterized protein n=1 Tax=Rubripirellula obstinata TaxID=406547 RepID=A0A5B1CPV9_9BACT|nr:hypothetical protein [Rubripirellula obstinata]KAA1262422.1 hypothetical protein LF1_49860 [Rubripirellula obstinata]
MKSAFRFVSVTAAALALTFTLGCAPPAPPEVDTSTEMVEPSSNTTTSAETPMTEEPAGE